MMSKEIINRFKREVLQDQESVFFLEMEDYAHCLKHCAQEIAEFIHALPNKTRALSALEKSYRDLNDIPIRRLYQGIHAIKENVAAINFYAREENKLVMKQSDVVSFFDKLNQFNTAANELIQQAINRSMVSH